MTPTDALIIAQTAVSLDASFRTKQDVFCFFITSQDDEGAHRGRWTVMERKASSHPHRSSVCQTETRPENLSQRCTAEPYTGTERHHKQTTNKQTR